MRWSDRLGTIGVWRSVRDTEPSFARAIEEIGYRALWLGGSPASDLSVVETLLDATDTLIVGTSVVNIWLSDPVELADSYHRIEARHPGRLILGIGSGHREAVARRTRPLAAMSAYLDVLDERGVPREMRVLSALGPRMLEMAAARSAGTIPYLTTAPQTAHYRTALGSDALVAPEQTVVLDPATESGRATARGFLTRYLGMSNYTSTMRSAGFSEEDVSASGTDRLVDGIIAHGDLDHLVRRIAQHLGAGADHVCIQVQPADRDPNPLLRSLRALSVMLQQ